MQTNQNILIIGAGLCGSLLALRLAQRGFKIKLVEKRPDLRKTDIAAGRSINLAISDRGIKAMTLVGLEKKLEKLCIPMNGRMIHNEEGQTFLSPYSGKKEEYINSISRTDLNALLLNEAEKMPNVEIEFNLDCKNVDFENTKVIFQDFNTKKSVEKSADVIIGTDGAGSAVRENMEKDKSLKFDLWQDFLQHGYKELSIPAAADGGYQIYKNALHIWPRGKNMLIALPNLDGSYTVTLFMSYKDGEDSLENLDSVEKVEAYFKKYYPDALKLMPDLGKDFFENPTGPLGTVKCSPWYFKGKTLLMGDSAHAIVPFYGQGMNASFEDVTVFDEILDENQDSWETVFSTYESKRKIDTDAIADLAIDNFHEMKEATASPLFQKKRKLETAFEQTYPEQYSSKYRLVTFQEEIRYSEAMKKGRAQDKAMLKLIADGKITDEQTLEEKLDLVKKTTDRFLENESVV